MRRIAKRLEDTQLILVCGHNSSLADELRAMPSRSPRAVVGFTSQIRYFMQLSDFFIGKPGPGSISEAIQQRLPVIVVRNAWTMPQERYNAQWVEENGVGLVLDSFRDIRVAVSALTSRMSEYRRRVARIDNRAIFEIPEILQQIVQSEQPRQWLLPDVLARPLVRAGAA
jgi:UDP-N-acetylglucosamine:LPS N-acetylglucosamine transferase